MNKKIFAAICLLLIGGLSIFFFNACDKDTNCYVEITVVDEVTKKPVKNAFVKIDIDSSYVSREGYTNANGRFDTQFDAPAIFKRATIRFTPKLSSTAGAKEPTPSV